MCHGILLRERWNGGDGNNNSRMLSAGAGFATLKPVSSRMTDDVQIAATDNERSLAVC